jgi:NTP pyrophosphatase (non-canonical NTP hydrolase)
MVGEQKTLSDAVRDFRRLVDPNFPNPSLKDCYMFLVSEVGELGDVILRSDPELPYLRGRPDKLATKEQQIGEVGDAMFMLISVANHLDVDVELALATTMGKIMRRVNSAKSECHGPEKPKPPCAQPRD